jgi:putative FmdB family regulatory protein
MPTYEYECQACLQRFDQWQSIKADPLTDCPKCAEGVGKLKRLIGPGAALLFKGSGFYLTDYRSDSYKKAAKAESPSTGGKSDGGSSGGSGDSGSSASPASGGSSASSGSSSSASSGSSSSGSTPSGGS